jgi:endonuclease YncB( thermonuclease family)
MAERHVTKQALEIGRVEVAGDLTELTCDSYQLTGAVRLAERLLHSPDHVSNRNIVLDLVKRALIAEHMRQLLATALIACLTVATAAGDDLPMLVGRASVIDGDTVEIRGQRIRIFGIDAPESSQLCTDKGGSEYRCGKVAADSLDEFLAQSRPLKCTIVDHDRNKRAVARCYRADGTDVAGWLVKNGLALDWPQYSKREYAALQAEAQAGRTGIWQGDFQEPWAFRHDRRLGPKR